MFSHSLTLGRILFGGAVLALAACADSTTPGKADAFRADHVGTGLAHGEPNAGTGDIKAFIGAWLDGEAVRLRYTRSYYCEEPPGSIADSGCEIGAPPENFPREGLIPMIYALAPVGFTPSDITTIHCSPASPCANHPPMIDVTRLNIPGVSIGTRPPHSHIIASRQAGWHRTINIRVLSSTVWNQIAADPSLETVRRMQSENPGLISPDIPTNIFFFFHVQSPAQQ